MSVISDIFGGLLGSSAAKSAAGAQENAANQAKSNSQANQTASINAQTGATAAQTAGAAPYTTAGATGANQLNSLLAPGGALTQGWNQSFQAPTAAQAAATPGYQFQLQQGQQAIQNSAAAAGGLDSGGTAKALDNYSQGLASTNYQQTYNNAFQNYQQNYGQFQQNQSNLYNRNLGVAQLGSQSTGQLNSLLQSGAQNQAAINATGAQQQGQDITNYGNAQAAGDIGSANAWENAIGGATGSLSSGGGVLGQYASLIGTM